MSDEMIPWLIVAFVAGMSAWFGAARVAARTWAALAFGLFMLLAAAGLCWIIGDNKTGGYMAGIVGAIFSILSLIAAGAVVGGAGLRWLYERLRPLVGERSASTGALGVVGVGLYSVIAVVLSLWE